MELGLGKLLKNVEKEVHTTIKKECDDYATSLLKTVEDAKEEVRQMAKTGPLLVVKELKKHKVEGLKHKSLNTLITLASVGQNVLLVGPAGTGKTKSAEQAAEALGLKFSCISVGSQTSKSDLLGYMNAEGKYVSTVFRDAYENGGLFCMDEIDAGNSNVLIVLNSALSNGICSFPDKIVKMHPDFRFVGTANTYGNGADRTYVGRNTLDGATLDRFTVIDWEVDQDLEKRLVEQFKNGDAWLKTIWYLRDDINQSGIRAIISPRMTVRCAMCWDLGNELEDVVKMCVLPQIPNDKRDSYEKKTIEKFKSYAGIK